MDVMHLHNFILIICEMMLYWFKVKKYFQILLVALHFLNGSTRKLYTVGVTAIMFLLNCAGLAYDSQ